MSCTAEDEACVVTRRLGTSWHNVKCGKRAEVDGLGSVGIRDLGFGIRSGDQGDLSLLFPSLNFKGKILLGY